MCIRDRSRPCPSRRPPRPRRPGPSCWAARGTPAPPPALWPTPSRRGRRGRAHSRGEPSGGGVGRRMAEADPGSAREETGTAECFNQSGSNCTGTLTTYNCAG
eukprot:11068369-Alexandrium_andersonii.AAC.1